MKHNALRIALVLPPVQSLVMPYCAPAVLAAYLRKNHGADTQIIDSGIEWLDYSTETHADLTTSGAFDALRQPQTFRSADLLEPAFDAARGALARICAPFAPERVTIDGRYEPPAKFCNWAAASDATLERGLFDAYYDDVLIPRLLRFEPTVIGLSLPFDWMVFPAMRLARRLASELPDAMTIVGGHAVQRLWAEREAEFFKSVACDWAAVSDGETSLDILIDHLTSGCIKSVSVPLVRLPPRSATATAPAVLSRRPQPDLVPAFDGYPLARYLRPEPLIPLPVSDGCYYGRCKFCSRQRSDQSVPFQESSATYVENVICNLVKQTGAKQFVFAGDIVTRRFMLTVAQRLAAWDEPPMWYCQASFKAQMGGQIDSTDAELLYNGGCRIILNGLESGSTALRSAMGAPVFQEKFDADINHLLQAGIIPFITIIVGYPGETRADLTATATYIRSRINQCVFALSHFEVVKGTPLAQQLARSPDARISRSSILDGSFIYSGPDTLSRSEVDQFLAETLAGLFGEFAEFIRSIPVLMQMISSMPPKGHLETERVWHTTA